MRDPSTNITILSGDIGADDAAVGGVTVAVVDIVGGNSKYVVIVVVQSGMVSTLDGFVVNAPPSLNSAMP